MSNVIDCRGKSLPEVAELVRASFAGDGTTENLTWFYKLNDPTSPPVYAVKLYRNTIFYSRFLLSDGRVHAPQDGQDLHFTEGEGEEKWRLVTTDVLVPKWARLSPSFGELLTA